MQKNIYNLAWTSTNLSNRNPQLSGHESQDGKDDESSEDGGARVDDRNEESVALTIVVAFVVAGQRDQALEWTDFLLNLDSVLLVD